MCDFCHQVCYQWEYDCDVYLDLNDIRKQIIKHKTSPECKRVLHIPTLDDIESGRVL